MLKFLVWHVLLVTISCELFNQEVGYSLEYAPTYNNYKPRDYHFDYAVSDPHTGDHKSQWEVKINGVVRGGYSLLEPDGTTRIVEYIADDDGFRAIVKKLGTAIHPVAPVAVVPVVPEVAHFRAYDGQVNNYASSYQIGVEPVVAKPQAVGVAVADAPVPQEVELKRIGDYLAGVEAIPVDQGRIQSQVDANLGTNGQVFRPAGIGGYNVDVNLGGGQIEAVPRYGEQFEAVRGQVFTPAGIGGYKVDVGLGGGQNLGRVEAVPPLQGSIGGYNLGYGGQIGTIEVSQDEMDSILAKYGLGGAVPPIQAPVQPNLAGYGTYGLGGGRIEAVPPVQAPVDPNLGRYGTYGPGGGRIEAVPPVPQAPLEPNLGQVFVPAGVGGYKVDVDLGGQGLAVPVPQTQNLGSVNAGPVSDGQNLQRIADNHLGQVPNLVPVSPTYSTNIEYHGLTGNLEDDSRYSNDDYRGSASRRVQKVVAAPTKGHSQEKREKPLKEQFLIYIPDTQSH